MNSASLPNFKLGKPYSAESLLNMGAKLIQFGLHAA